MATFLIADNSQTVTEILSFALEQKGHKAFATNNSDDIFTILEKNKIDFALLNTQIQNTDATYLASKIKKKFPEITILIMSNTNNQQLKIKAKESGVSGWILKPFIPERLIKIIEKTFLTNHID